MDLTLYWFMFPVALGIATLANATGIEGATFFSPIFILLLRLDPRIAIGTALITQVFGFGSSVASYVQRKWINYKLAAQLLMVTVPLALVGVYFAGSIPTAILKSIFGVGLLAMGVLFLQTSFQNERQPIAPDIRPTLPHRPTLSVAGAPSEEIGSPLGHPLDGMILCGVGGLFLGLIGSGQGAMNGYYLLRRRQLPSQVAVATSVLVIAITGLTASLGYVLTFVHAGSDALTQVLSLVIYTVPGVMIGGQLAPMLAVRLDKQTMERLLTIIFIFIGGITLWTTWNGIR